jgi:hypothetical protein
MVYTWFGGLFADLSMVFTGAILLACFAPDFGGVFGHPAQRPPGN